MLQQPLFATTLTSYQLHGKVVTSRLRRVDRKLFVT